MLFNKIWPKLLLSVVIAIISVLSQLETFDDTLVSNKDVVLSKPPIYVFEFVTRLEDYSTWFPNVKRITSKSNQDHMSIGKTYQQTSTYLFGVGETTSSLVVVGYSSPSYFEYLTDIVILQRDVIHIESIGANKTRLNWKIYSRRRSLLFKYAAIPFYQFYYHNILREALFQMQFSFR